MNDAINDMFQKGLANTGYWLKLTGKANKVFRELKELASHDPDYRFKDFALTVKYGDKVKADSIVMNILDSKLCTAKTFRDFTKKDYRWSVN